MATHVRESSSVEVVTKHCDAITAALESDPETAPLAETWTALTTKADALAVAQRALERAERRSLARMVVIDDTWDRECAAFGRAVVDAAGGDRKSALYRRFFAKLPPSEAETLGVAREIALGEAYLAELAREPTSPLAVTFTPRLGAATAGLRDALGARRAALSALGQHRTAVVLFIDDVNRELDRTEGELLKRFPGDRGRVASYLATTRPAPRRAAADAEAEDETEG
jgi:hypothetical protein